MRSDVQNRQRSLQNKRRMPEEESKLRNKCENQREAEKLRRCFADWQAYAMRFFDSLETTDTLSFPEPKIDACQDCQLRMRRGEIEPVLRICQHSLERLLLSPKSYEETLRKEKRRWHPDKFHRVAERDRDEIMKKATVMFQLLGNLPVEKQ